MSHIDGVYCEYTDLEDDGDRLALELQDDDPTEIVVVLKTGVGDDHVTTSVKLSGDDARHLARMILDHVGDDD